MDTIFALATAPGRAGVAVIRVSGPESAEVLTHFHTNHVEERRASLRKLVWNGDLVDEALILRFEPGQSFTGEAVVELQTHGSMAVVKKLLSCMATLPGFRPAEAGEFTQRALLNNRLDLTQVEGLADLIEAETEAQLLQANRSFQGAFSARVEDWRSRLIRAAALIEATIDFADEEVPVDVSPEVQALIEGLLLEFRKELSGIGFAESVRDGFEIAIIGAPNVGKSTLLNRLAGRDVAITSEIAGTTRDVVEVRMDLSGFPVTLLDTAGLRDATDEIEKIGISRAVARAQNADLRVFLGDAPMEIERHAEDIVLHPKADLGAPDGSLTVSGKTGQGIDALCANIARVLSGRSPSGIVASNARHRASLLRGTEVLDQVFAQLEESNPYAELLAQDMRSVIAELDGLVGRIGVEDLLGEIFSSFCIGK